MQDRKDFTIAFQKNKEISNYTNKENDIFNKKRTSHFYKNRELPEALPVIVLNKKQKQ